MASVEKRTRGGRVVWRAHYRTPEGAQRNKSFSRRVDAERFLTTVEASKLVGGYVDPSLGRVSVGEWSTRWLAGQTHFKASTRERYSGIVRAHVLPRWSGTKLIEVSHAEVQAWVTQLSRLRSPATVRKIHRVLSLILAMAVRDGRLARNPADDVNLPRVSRAERRYLTHEQVDALARACAAPAPELVGKYRRHSERQNDAYRLIVLFLAYTGVRFGELAALRSGGSTSLADERSLPNP